MPGPKIWIPFLILATPFCAQIPSVFAEDAPDFNRDVRPILSAKCFACHGPDEKAREGELRLDTAEGIRANPTGQPVVVPGKPEKSGLIARIESKDESEQMPPAESGFKLSDEEKQTLKKWIAAGAEYRVHWSFAVPKRSRFRKLRTPSGPIIHWITSCLPSWRKPVCPRQSGRIAINSSGGFPWI